MPNQEVASLTCFGHVRFEVPLMLRYPSVHVDILNRLLNVEVWDPG